MTPVYHDSRTEARTHLKALLDAAERRVATVRRDAAATAVVDVDGLRHDLATVRPSGTQVVSEADGWPVLISEPPAAAYGATFDDALREYAKVWRDHLLDAHHHREPGTGPADGPQ